MSDDERPSLHDALEGGDTDCEFELDVEVLVEMRKREAEVLAAQEQEDKRRQQTEQQLALHQRYLLLQEEQMRRDKEQRTAAAEERMSDEEIDTPRLIRDVSSMSTASTLSTSAEAGRGYVTVVDVNIVPHRHSSDSPAAADSPLVDVRMHVFQRFVPHLATAALTIRRVSQSHAEYIKQMEAEEGYSSDTSSEGTEDEAHEETAKPLHLTGDRQIDAAMLRKLIGMASDDSGSDSDSEVQPVNSRRTTMQHDDDEDDETGVSAVLPLRTKHELAPAALPPVQPFAVSPSDSLVYCGTVTAIVDAMLIVQCQPGGRALDLGSAVCMENRTALGRVDEVFGPVSEPMYCIRPLEGVDVVKAGLVEGARVYNVPSQSSYVLPDTTPGSDASNLFDEEVETEAQEWSDDEKESEAKSRRKKDKKGRNNSVSFQQQQQQSNKQALPQEPNNKSPRYRFAPSSGQHAPRPHPAATSPSYGPSPPQHNQHTAPPFYHPPHPMYGHPPPPLPQAHYAPPAYGYSPYNPVQRPGFYPPPPGMQPPTQYGAYPPMLNAGAVSGWQYPHAGVAPQQQQQVQGSGAAR